MTALPWFFSLCVLLGGVLNILKRPEGFILWMASNGFFAGRTYLEGQYAECATFCANFVLACYWWWSWRRKR